MINAVRSLLNGTAKLSVRQSGRIGYRFLARPRRPAVDAPGQQFLRWAEQDQIRIHGHLIQTYHWPGKGPKVLLLHGWESCSARWQAYFNDFREAGYDIYAFDGPGQGRSSGKVFSVMLYAAILEAYLEHFDGFPEYWVGHSAGGMAAIYYLIKREGRLKPAQLVLLGVPGELSDFVDKFVDVLQVNDGVRDAIEREFIRKHGMSFAEISFIEMAQSLDIPGLILHDREDDLAPFSGAEAIHANWPQSQLIATSGRTHSLLGEDIPKLVLDYLSGKKVANPV